MMKKAGKPIRKIVTPYPKYIKVNFPGAKAYFSVYTAPFGKRVVLKKAHPTATAAEQYSDAVKELIARLQAQRLRKENENVSTHES